MVGVGVLMLLFGWIAAWQFRRRGELQPWLLRGLVGMTFSGWVATVSGWYVAEIGRQPWLVHGVLTTRQAASDVAAPLIGISLGMYLTLYALLITAYISVVFHLARKSSQRGTAEDPTTGLQHA
jgi:cytochrome d ubiquinol oxidase subunit I